MCLFQNSAGLGALLAYDRHGYVFVAQYLLSTALLTLNVASACEAVVNARINGGDQDTYNLDIASYQVQLLPRPPGFRILGLGFRVLRINGGDQDTYNLDIASYSCCPSRRGLGF